MRLTPGRARNITASVAGGTRDMCSKMALDPLVSGGVTTAWRFSSCPPGEASPGLRT